MTKKHQKSKSSERHEALRKEIESGRATSYYINKKGESIQKVTVHLPYDMVTRLKKEAIDLRVTLSELIRERFK